MARGLAALTEGEWVRVGVRRVSAFLSSLEFHLFGVTTFLRRFGSEAESFAALTGPRWREDDAKHHRRRKRKTEREILSGSVLPPCPHTLILNLCNVFTTCLAPERLHSC